MRQQQPESLDVRLFHEDADEGKARDARGYYAAGPEGGDPWWGEPGESDGGESDLSGDEGEFTDDEEDDFDTTAEAAARGRDVQGIPWDRLQYTREEYRVRLGLGGWAEGDGPGPVHRALGHST